MLGIVIIVLAVWLAVALVLRARGHRPAPRPFPRLVPPPVPQRAAPADDVPTDLYYVHWRGTDRPIYFGIAEDVAERARGHADRSWWWPLSSRTLTTFATYPTRTAAKAAEAEMIRRMALGGARLTNVQHNPYPVRREDIRVPAPHAQRRGPGRRARTPRRR